MIEAIVPGESIAVFIGPEGGFDESEIAEARDAGMKTHLFGKPYFENRDGRACGAVYFNVSD